MLIHTLSRLLGAAVLAASLATAGTAGAAEQPAAPRDEPTPTYRAVEPTADDPPPSFGPNRRYIYSGIQRRGDRLYLRGDVQSYYGRRVVVQKRRCETCDWKRYDVTRTSRHGWFRSAIGAPKRGSTFWRAKVGASDGWARSYSSVWETYY